MGGPFRESEGFKSHLNPIAEGASFSQPLNSWVTMVTLAFCLLLTMTVF